MLGTLLGITTKTANQSILMLQPMAKCHLQNRILFKFVRKYLVIASDIPTVFGAMPWTKKMVFMKISKSLKKIPWEINQPCLPQVTATDNNCLMCSLYFFPREEEWESPFLSPSPAGLHVYGEPPVLHHLLDVLEWPLVDVPVRPTRRRLAGDSPREDDAAEGVPGEVVLRGGKGTTLHLNRLVLSFTESRSNLNETQWTIK